MTTIPRAIIDAFGVLGWIELSAAFVVAIGCVGELWILINKLTRQIEPISPNASRFWRMLAWVDLRMRPLIVRLKIKGRKLSVPKEELLERLFVMLVAVGVTVEFVALPFSMFEIAELNRQAGQANKQAGEAWKLSAKANGRAALAESNNLVLRSNLWTLEHELPEKKPVFSAYAFVRFTIKATNFIKAEPLESATANPPIPVAGNLFLTRRSERLDSIANLLLTGDKFSQYGNEITMDLAWSSIFRRIAGTNRNETAEELIAELNRGSFSAILFKSAMAVADAKLTLVLN